MTAIKHLAAANAFLLQRRGINLFVTDSHAPNPITKPNARQAPNLDTLAPASSQFPPAAKPAPEGHGQGRRLWFLKHLLHL